MNPDIYRKSSFVYISRPLDIGYALILPFLVHITPNMHPARASNYGAFL